MRAGLEWRGSSGPSRRGALSGAAAKDGGAAVRASSMASAQDGRRASSTKIKSVSLRRRPPRGADRGRAPPDGDRSGRDRRPPPRWPGRALDGRCAATCAAGGDATEGGAGAAQARSSPGAAHAMGLSVFGAKFRVGSFGMCRTGASVVETAWGRRRAASVSGALLRAAARLISSQRQPLAIYV